MWEKGPALKLQWSGDYMHNWPRVLHSLHDLPVGLGGSS